MSKIDQAKTDEVYVCGFVPKYLLPSKMPWSLDPFLHPLITDIEDSFINGMYACSYTYSYIWANITIYCNLQLRDCSSRIYKYFLAIGHIAAYQI